MTKTIDNTKPVSLADMLALVNAGRMRRLTDARTVAKGATVYGHFTTSGADDPREWSEYIPMRVERTWKNAIRLVPLTDGTACKLRGEAGNWQLDSDEVFVAVEPVADALAEAPHVVIVWRTEGIGFERIIGPFATREEAMAYRLRFPVATAKALDAIPPDAKS